MNKSRFRSMSDNALFSSSSQVAIHPVPNAALNPSAPQSGRLLIVGESDAAQQVANLLALDGVMTSVAVDGRAALDQVPPLTPDVIVFGDRQNGELLGGEVIRQIHSRLGKPPGVVVIGHANEQNQVIDLTDATLLKDAGMGSGGDYFPADVGVAQLAVLT